MGQEVLNPERIFQAALTIIDEAGVPALTMRALAVRLGVDPMALYRHVKNKEAVIAGVIQLVYGDLNVPPPNHASWQEGIRDFACGYIGTIKSHPNLVVHLVTHTASSAQAALLACERLYGPLEAAGLPPRQVVLAADLIADYLHGYALAFADGDFTLDTDRTSFRRAVAAAPAEQYPVQHRILLEQWPEGGVAADMEAGLNIILLGVECWATLPN